MPDLFTRLGPLTMRTFNLALVLAAAVGALALVARARGTTRFAALADAALGGLIGAAVGGRLAYALINADAFGGAAEEVFRLSAGGLDWHGAVIGGLIGLALAARWRGLSVLSLLDALTPALPLMALLSWYGCWAAACGYGAEVDTLARYPSFAVAEARDVYGIIAPRYNTQVFGIALGLVLFAVAVALMTVPRLRRARFWLVLGLLSAGMFAIGFYRGDATPISGSLRADQWLDGVVMAISLALAIVASAFPAVIRSWRRQGGG